MTRRPTFVVCLESGHVFDNVGVEVPYWSSVSDDALIARALETSSLADRLTAKPRVFVINRTMKLTREEAIGA